MPLFGTSKKSPQELVRSLNENLKQLPHLKEKEKSYQKMVEEVSKALQNTKTLLYGTGDQEPASDQVAVLSNEIYNHHILELLVVNLARIDFEGRKDVVAIFNNILRRQIGTRNPTEDYIVNRRDILIQLVKGYENQEIALNCGMMLRECCRFESLAKVLLDAPEFYKFFEYVEVSTFDIASDAFSTFKELLTRHKAQSATFLEKNYDEVFSNYQRLLNSENYVTRRQALKLLGEILLDRYNFSTMNRYISNPENLKLMMNMLREKSRNIQFEAFHVFKIFVANPSKKPPIFEILFRNQDRLVEFLQNFHTDRTDDEQFTDERTYLIKQIKELKEAPK